MISGSARNRKLKVPAGQLVRPTSDRVKEALFNIISTRVEGSYILDLFAGSGSIGIEALSRGADKAVFIESNHRHASIIEENLKTCGFDLDVRLIRTKVSDGLRILYAEGVAFDLIFLDPPYMKDSVVATLADISRYHLLKENGLVIVESSKRDSMPQIVEDLQLLRVEKYGDTTLSFYGKLKYRSDY
ncbi:MAG: 16S rRNA (guanine(966)-N(2))-methyltransferase RsmD [Pelotomaculum sp.]